MGIFARLKRKIRTKQRSKMRITWRGKGGSFKTDGNMRVIK